VIAAVLFDLDDTLYPQAAWLAGAWAAVAARGATLGLSEPDLLAALDAVAALGTDRGRIIDRALERCGYSNGTVAPLVEAFRMHAPAVIDCYPGVVEELRELTALVPVGIVTDGDPGIQRGKVRALRLTVDVVVCSDEDGRAHRKPDPLPFRCALDALGVDGSRAVFVGDRPDKDVAGAIAVGMRTVRVRTGEYASLPDEPAPWRSVATAADAIRLLRHELAGDRDADGAAAFTGTDLR
jgi:putative hydrolase of the HAD superfamily